MRVSCRTTPSEELTRSKFQSPPLHFGEAVLAKESGAQGQTGFIVGSGHLDGTVDEDK